MITSTGNFVPKSREVINFGSRHRPAATWGYGAEQPDWGLATHQEVPLTPLGHSTFSCLLFVGLTPSTPLCWTNQSLSPLRNCVSRNRAKLKRRTHSGPPEVPLIEAAGHTTMSPYIIIGEGGGQDGASFRQGLRNGKSIGIEPATNFPAIPCQTFRNSESV